MLESAQGWIAILGVLVAILAAVALAFAYLAGSYNKQRIAALREDVEDSQRREKVLEAQIERLSHEQVTQQAQFSLELNNCQEQIVHLTAENEHLRELVLQRVEISSLSVVLESLVSMLANHDERVLDYWETMSTTLQLLKDELQHFNRKLEALRNGEGGDDG